MTEYGPVADGSASSYERSIAASPPAAMTLPTTVDAPAVARRHLRSHIGSLYPAALGDALILTSELVSNAVVHGEPEITLTVRIGPSALTVIVADGSPELPSPIPTLASPESVRGRGLAIVDALATRWGVIPRPAKHGKAIWFVLTYR